MKLGTFFIIRIMLNNIGLVNNHLLHYENAINNFKKSYNILKKQKITQQSVLFHK